MPSSIRSTLGENTVAVRMPPNTTTSASLLTRSQRSLAMGVSSGMRRAGAPTPLFFERGEGPYYFDVDGNRFLDYTLAWGPLILGNGHPAVVTAVTDQLSKAFAFGAQHRGLGSNASSFQTPVQKPYRPPFGWLGHLQAGRCL